MGLAELLIIAIGVAMDAFAVSICKGLAMKRASLGKAAVCGLWFGGFQALMPAIGYFAGTRFTSYIASADHWVAFILLALLGINMIKEAMTGSSEADGSTGFKVMFAMAVATSIDALAVGITFACMPLRIFSGIPDYANMLFGAGVIGAVTFVLSCAGVKIGSVFGAKYKSGAEFAGGAVLILVGVKILLEHSVKSM